MIAKPQLPNSKRTSGLKGTFLPTALRGGLLESESIDSQKVECQHELARVRFLENKVVAEHTTPGPPTMRVQLQLR